MPIKTVTLAFLRAQFFEGLRLHVQASLTVNPALLWAHCCSVTPSTLFCHPEKPTWSLAIWMTSWMAQ